MQETEFVCLTESSTKFVLCIDQISKIVHCEEKSEQLITESSSVFSFFESYA